MNRLAWLTPLLAVLAACDGTGPVEGETAPGTEAGEATAGVGAAAAPTGGTLYADGQVRPIDIQFAHPNGVVLQLTSIQSRQTETAIGVRVINGREREVWLNRFNNSRRGYIVLDNGERLYLSPPVANPDISVPAGQTLEGELVFLGRLPPVASATLILNDSGSTDNAYTSTPTFRIDLPLVDQAT